MLCVNSCALGVGHHHGNTVDSLQTAVSEKNDEIIRLNAELEVLSETNRYLTAELERNRDVLDYAEKQFISLEKGLQSHETKASAVAALAEAKLAYDKFIQGHPGAAGDATVKQAREKIDQSDALVPTERYAASVYFARRAIRLLDQHDSIRTMRIVSVSQANLREGPGLNYPVVDHLAIGTVLIELERSNDWYHVESKTGSSGWIHASVTITRQ